MGKKETRQKSLAKAASPSRNVTVPSIAARSDGGLIIGALAFSQEDTCEARWFTDRDLVFALRAAKPKASIVLCSGARFWTDRQDKKTKKVPMQTIAREIYAAAECPVLFEWPDDDDASAWFAATRRGMVRVRRNQYVKGVEDIGGQAALVLAELAMGAGVIPVAGCDHVDRLVLLICNEAKILDGYKRKKLIVVGLDDVFGGKWALLHPAHRPYDNPPNRTGRDLVVPKGKVAPRLARATKPGATLSFGKGLRGPHAVVHAGPFRQYRKAFDRNVAVIGFRGGHTMGARASILEPPGLATWRYGEFEV